MPRRCAAIVCFLLIAGCGSEPLPGYVAPSIPPAPPADTAASVMAPAYQAPRQVPWAPISFIYQLQNAKPLELAATGANLFIIDYSSDGSDSGAYTARDLATIRGNGAEVRVLAYLCIGEAEDYRWYWQRAWDARHDGRPDRGAPAWLGRENPAWRGNYRVRYWDPAWRRITEQYLERIITAGFDGVYLDCVDAFEYWGPDGNMRQQRATAAADMMALVRHIASSARTQRPGFLVVPQNGEALGADPDYLALVDGIGREDVWCNGNRVNQRREITGTLNDLQRFTRAGKFVLTIDYVTRANLRQQYFTAAENSGFLALAPPRALDRCPTAAMRPRFPGP